MKYPPPLPPNLLHFAFDSNSMSGFYNVVQTGYKQISYVLQLKKSGTGVRLQINYMSRVARKRFFGVHAPDSPACAHVDTETNIFNFRLRIFGDFSISAGKFRVKNWYRFFTFVKIEYHFFTSEKNRTSLSQMTRIRTNSSQLK